MKQMDRTLRILLAVCMACALFTTPALAAPESTIKELPKASVKETPPETPEVPEQPETPQTPETPEQPEDPEVPGTPEPSEDPQTPGTPEPAPEEGPGWLEVPDDIAACRTPGNGCPYYIMVNRSHSTVTVYGLDEAGYYTVPVRAMVCSTGREGHETPLGDYAVTRYRRLWNLMVDGTYGQYAVQFNGNILFHSVCYAQKSPSALLTEEYNMLGSPASRGCVRLQTVDAKWIYDNCAAGTMVTVYDGTVPGALGKPERAVEYISPEQANGWDPTDPGADNPWRSLPGTQEPAPETPPAETPPAGPAPQPGEGETLYTVMRGDTLGTISMKFYGQVSRYMEIYRRNQGTLSDPNRIYAGQVLVIPGVSELPAAPETAEI